MKYKIEELKLRRKINLVKVMYTQSSNIDNLKKITTDKNLRSKNKIELRKNLTSKTKVFNIPLYRGIRLWDTLPAEMQKDTNKHSFKKKISSHVV